MARWHKPDKLERLARLKVTKLRLLRAQATLTASGVQLRSRYVYLRVRMNPAVLKETKARSGIGNTSMVVNAALKLLAAEDGFGRFLISLAGELSEDFESAI